MNLRWSRGGYVMLSMRTGEDATERFPSNVGGTLLLLGIRFRTIADREGSVLRVERPQHARFKFLRLLGPLAFVIVDLCSVVEHVLVLRTDPGLVVFHPVFPFTFYEPFQPTPVMHKAAMQIIRFPNVKNVASSFGVRKLEPVGGLNHINSGVMPCVSRNVILVKEETAGCSLARPEFLQEWK